MDVKEFQERLIQSLKSSYNGTLVANRNSLVKAIYKYSLPYTDMNCKHTKDTSVLSIGFPSFKVVITLHWELRSTGISKLYDITCP